MDLKNALLEILSCMISPNAEVRRIAEERKKALEVTEEYAIHLLEILLSTEEAVEERQMATILLRHYVLNHWSESYESFVSPKASDVVKQKIRDVLPMGLFEPIKKIRSHIAYILATVAADDYPHDWPNMCEAIFLIFENRVDSLGAIDFINEFSKLTTKEQLHRAAEPIYTVLYLICKDHKKYPIKIRSEAVFALGNFVSLHCIDNKDNPKLLDVVRNFCEVITSQLSLPHPQESDFVLKLQILRTYSLWLLHIPEAIGKTIIDMLPTIWLILSRCGQLYEEMLVSEALPYRDPTENLEDTPLLYTLTYAIFELLFNLLNDHRAVLEITSALPDLLYYMILFMSLPKETEVLWKTDPEIYVAEEVNDSNTVRAQAKELLVIMTKEINASSLQSGLSEAMIKHIVLSNSNSEIYHSKIMESVMYTVGSIRNFLIRLHNQKELTKLNILDYLNKWIVGGDFGITWYILARIMWVGGKFSSILTADTLHAYVMTSVSNIHDREVSLRYAAIRSLCLHLHAFSNPDRNPIFMGILDPVAQALLDALEHCNGYILQVGLNAVEQLVYSPITLNECIENKLVRLMQHVFVQHLNCPEKASSIHMIFKKLCSIKSVYKNIEERFMPIITHILNNVATVTIAAFQAQLVAIEILNIIVKHCPETVSEEVIRCGFFGVYHCIITYNDIALTQSGADCLRSYLLKAPNQILTFVDPEGCSGVNYVLNILRFFLDPQKMEFACIQVGLLSITAMQTLGPHLEEHISSLLREVLSTMQRANTPLIEESLLIIFAYLFYYHLEVVINYLNLIPGPHGESALTFVMNKWLSNNYPCGSGKYQHNLNVLALTKIMEHTIVAEDEKIAEIKVADIPVLVKILKLLLYVLPRELETFKFGTDENSINAFSSIAPEVEDSLQVSIDSEGDSEWRDWEILFDSLYPLYGDDPIYNIKLCDYLTNFLKNVSKSAYFLKCLQYFTNTEREVLIKIGINLNVENFDSNLVYSMDKQ